MYGLVAGLAVGAGLGAALGIFACGSALFTCAEDGECQDGGVGGVCQPEGVCSFPDGDCDSGQRFGAHSGGVSNECVPDSAADTTGAIASTGVTAASADDGDPTLDVSGVATLPDTSSSEGTLDDTADPTTTTGLESTTGIDVDPTLLLWFTFEHDTEDALVNDGVLGGSAPCVLGSCPVPIDEGPIGKAATFDGEGNCGIFPFVEELNPDEFTLASWLRRDVSVEGYDGAFTKPVGEGAFNTWRMYMTTPTDGEDVLGVHVGTADNSGVDVTQVVVLGVWTHVAATWTGSELEMFVDGVSVGSMPSMFFEEDEHDVYVGCDDDVPVGITHFFHGSLDDVRMYSRVLDKDEIAELAAPSM
jgi:hypothetical protein